MDAGSKIYRDVVAMGVSKCCISLSFHMERIVSYINTVFVLYFNGCCWLLSLEATNGSNPSRRSCVVLLIFVLFVENVAR